MKEVIDTAPVIEAFESQDECPFCYVERMAEQRAINYVAGSCASYMEPEVRAITDRQGFCANHLKKLYDFGNALGNALIMQTHFIDLNRELEQELSTMTAPGKRKLLSKPEEPAILNWLRSRNRSCYLCSRVEQAMHRYFVTFYALLKEPEFRSRVENCKGFCFRHFEQLLEHAADHLPNAQRRWFYTAVPTVFKNNLARVQGDLEWFIAKFDYRNAKADWKNSRNAVPRAMQKLQGSHPSDPPFKKN